MIGLHLEAQCVRCIHKKEGGLICDAYPNGIPIMLTTSQFKHTEAYPGDNGIRYELNPQYEGWEKEHPYVDMIESGRAKVW